MKAQRGGARGEGGRSSVPILILFVWLSGGLTRSHTLVIDSRLEKETKESESFVFALKFSMSSFLIFISIQLLSMFVSFDYKPSFFRKFMKTNVISFFVSNYFFEQFTFLSTFLRKVTFLSTFLSRSHFFEHFFEHFAVFEHFFEDFLKYFSL